MCTCHEDRHTHSPQGDVSKCWCSHPDEIRQERSCDCLKCYWKAVGIKPLAKCVCAPTAFLLTWTYSWLCRSNLQVCVWVCVCDWHHDLKVTLDRRIYYNWPRLRTCQAPLELNKQSSTNRKQGAQNSTITQEHAHDAHTLIKACVSITPLLGQVSRRRSTIKNTHADSTSQLRDRCVCQHWQQNTYIHLHTHTHTMVKTLFCVHSFNEAPANGNYTRAVSQVNERERYMKYLLY